MTQLLQSAILFSSGVFIGLAVGFIIGTYSTKHRLEGGKVDLARLFTFILIPTWLVVLVLQFVFGIDVPRIVHILFGIPIGDVFGLKLNQLWGRK